MPLKLIEGVVDDLKTYLSANMGAKLVSLNLEYADALLTGIKAYYIAEQTSIPEFPSIIIIGDETIPDLEGNGWMHSNHAITIACLAINQDTEILKRLLYRYMRAVIELLIESRASGYAIKFTRINFSPIYGREGEFLSDASLSIMFKRYETK